MSANIQSSCFFLKFFFFYNFTEFVPNSYGVLGSTLHFGWTVYFGFTIFV